MGAGYHGGFGKTLGKERHQNGKVNVDLQNNGITNKIITYKNGQDYNIAKSKSVRGVKNIVNTYNVHSVPAYGEPNSVSVNYQNGIVDSERYFDEKGYAYLDIDYTNHGNAKTHPNVPHEHSISFDKEGNLIRKNEPNGGINK